MRLKTATCHPACCVLSTVRTAMPELRGRKPRFRLWSLVMRSLVLGAFMGTANSIMVNCALIEISLSPFFALAFGFLFLISGAAVGWQATQESADAQINRMLLYCFAVLTTASGFTSFLLERDWSHGLSARHKVADAHRGRGDCALQRTPLQLARLTPAVPSPFALAHACTQRTHDRRIHIDRHLGTARLAPLVGTPVSTPRPHARCRSTDSSGSRLHSLSTSPPTSWWARSTNLRARTPRRS